MPATVMSMGTSTVMSTSISASTLQGMIQNIALTRISRSLRRLRKASIKRTDLPYKTRNTNRISARTTNVTPKGLAYTTTMDQLI